MSVMSEGAGLAMYGEREGKRAHRAAGRLFGFSILYLSAVFAALLVDAGISGQALTGP